MANKPFSETLYVANDDAKFQIIEWLKTQGYNAWLNPNQYGIDVLAEKDSNYYQMEVEVKHNWKGKEFPFGTIHFPERKRKFAKRGELTWFVMLNHERTHAMIITGTHFMEAPVVVKDTKFTRNEEYVEILTSKGKIVSLKEEGK
jgi:hypothetical protein